MKQELFEMFALDDGGPPVGEEPVLRMSGCFLCVTKLNCEKRKRDTSVT